MGRECRKLVYPQPTVRKDRYDCLTVAGEAAGRNVERHLPMPTFFHYDGYKFFFYSNEGDPRVPMHVHVMKAGCEAKFWLRPVGTVAANKGFAARTLGRLERVVAARRETIGRGWREYFG